MPYVQVWVDDEPCDGTCEGCVDAAKRKDQMDDAIMHLRNGNAEAALEALGAEHPDRKSAESLKQAYETWKRGGLPGFTNYKPRQKDAQP